MTTKGIGDTPMSFVTKSTYWRRFAATSSSVIPKVAKRLRRRKVPSGDEKTVTSLMTAYAAWNTPPQPRTRVRGKATGAGTLAFLIICEPNTSWYLSSPGKGSGAPGSSTSRTPTNKESDAVRAQVSWTSGGGACVLTWVRKGMSNEEPDSIVKGSGALIRHPNFPHDRFGPADVFLVHASSTCCCKCEDWLGRHGAPLSAMPSATATWAPFVRAAVQGPRTGRAGGRGGQGEQGARTPLSRRVRAAARETPVFRNCSLLERRSCWLGSIPSH